MKHELILAYKKSTPGTHVYHNADTNISFYLPKLMLSNPSKKPEQIKLTIEADE